jgi:hypothetical protein
MTDQPGGMHRLIVAALGDEEALAAVGPDGFLAPAPWGEAVERTRRRRYPALSVDEGHRRVGADVARAFLASPGGQLVAATLPELELARAFASVFTPMAERLRRSLDFDFELQPVGGLIRVRGPRAVPPEHIEGFFGALLERVRGAHRVTLARVEPELIELHVS